MYSSSPVVSTTVSGSKLFCLHFEHTDWDGSFSISFMLVDLWITNDLIR